MLTQVELLADCEDSLKATSEVVVLCRSRIKDQEAMAVAVAVKKVKKNDVSYTRTLIFIPNHLTGGRTTQARDYIKFLGVNLAHKKNR